ncbi:MAG TPA: SDR family NAD(P)-dependent oxidoreductase [Bacteroidales bacterium]|nr:SDR family NAD(P)-dependent oxidoreductase [Bacteroidales bacterium]
MKTKEKYAFITGASMGLGRELAIESARRGRNVILVALPGRNLGQFCLELVRSYGVRAVAHECDLTDEKALNRLVKEVLENYSVDTLINNAGVGGTKRFEDSTPEYLDAIIHLNIRATTMLTRMMLPELRSHPGALIMNVASVAAFGPLPYKTIYPASKAFVYYFTRSLSRELRGTGVHVTVVTPGPIVTNPDVALRIMTQGGLGRLGLLTAGKIARLALDGAAKRRVVIVPGIMSRVNRFLLRWFPESWQLSLMSRIFEKELDYGIAPIRQRYLSTCKQV